MKPLHGPQIEAFCLPSGVDDDVSAQDRTGVKNEAVDDSVLAGTDVFDVQTHLGQQLVNQMLELPGSQVHEVKPVVQVSEDVRLDPRTNYVVWQYGHTHVAGNGPGYLNNPTGLDLYPPSSVLNK
jgi:hypothetical protein